MQHNYYVQRYHHGIHRFDMVYTILEMMVVIKSIKHNMSNLTNI
jgi:hypothetical protein